MGFWNGFADGFKQSVSASLYASARSYADNAVDSVMNPLYGKMNDMGLGSLASYLDGRINGFLDSKLGSLSGGSGSSLSQGYGVSPGTGNFWTSPNKAFGGVSPQEARELFLDWTGIELASNSLYLIEITDLNPASGFFGGNTGAFQLFTTSLNYSPVTIPPDKTMIGSAVMDGVKSTEHIDLSLTTYDDSKGTLKRWFDKKAAAIAHADGTIGLPNDYLVKVRVLHSFFSDKTNRGGYEIKMLMRPVSIEHSLSREEGGKQQLQMQFTQFDTFMSA